jgi:hypothetical protein
MNFHRKTYHRELLLLGGVEGCIEEEFLMDGGAFYVHFVIMGH